MIGAAETTRVRYNKGQPEVKTERKTPPQRGSRRADEGPSKKARAFARTKREERERRQRQAQIRTTALWVGLAVLVVGIVVGAFAIYNSQAFAVTRTDVRGLSRMSKPEVLRLAAISPDTTLLRVDTAAIEKAVSASPWVAEVEVSREFPDALVISVKERTPTALVVVGEKSWLLAQDATWITPIRTKEASASAVPITGVPGLVPEKGKHEGSAELTNALRVIDGLSPELRKIVVSVNAPELDKTALITTSDIEIIVGRADDMARKDTIIRRILAEQRGKVVYINVRTTDRPTWRGLENTP